MVGTDGAALASSWTAALATILANFSAARIGYLDELAAANLPTDVAAIPTTMVGTDNAATETKQDIIDGIVDAIKTIADKLDSAMEVDGAVHRFTENALEKAPSGTGGDATEAKQDTLIQILTGKWEVVGNQFIIYDTDGVTPLYTYDLTQDGIATEFNPDLRSPV